VHAQTWAVDVKTPWLQEQQAGSPATNTCHQQPEWTKNFVKSHMAKKIDTQVQPWTTPTWNYGVRLLSEENEKVKQEWVGIKWEKMMGVNNHGMVKSSLAGWSNPRNLFTPKKFL
jgi:hypothetical protein